MSCQICLPESEDGKRRAGATLPSLIWGRQASSRMAKLASQILERQDFLRPANHAFGISVWFNSPLPAKFDTWILGKLNSSHQAKYASRTLKRPESFRLANIASGLWGGKILLIWTNLPRKI